MLLQEVENNLLTITTIEAGSIDSQLGEVARFTQLLQHAQEFMIVCPRIDRDGIEQAAEKLRLSIAGHDFPIVDRATASFGMTLARPGESMSALIARADSALYAAKEAGRNRVHSAD
ncbi:GGDEF domain-containing protein [Allochromatium tepidum]|uniref:diguanylate cyclase n=1 Tax=Allochromatium tepidum TaxID=553982 RepID=A0ABN6GBU5_9GAMM|nr:diguanylate cyclase [Allochromatium tepidum]BCU07402.1 hypothetical protein Atep_20790 [Allochromatium tepidum]